MRVGSIIDGFNRRQQGQELRRLTARANGLQPSWRLLCGSSLEEAGWCGSARGGGGGRGGGDRESRRAAGAPSCRAAPTCMALLVTLAVFSVAISCSSSRMLPLLSLSSLRMRSSTSASARRSLARPSTSLQAVGGGGGGVRA
jgi:hypothetical protein